MEAARAEEEAARGEAPGNELAKQQRRQQRRLAEKETASRVQPQKGAGKWSNGLYEPVQVPPVVQASLETTPDVPPTNDVGTHSGNMVNVSWVQQGASVWCAWREVVRGG